MNQNRWSLNKFYTMIECSLLFKKESILQNTILNEKISFILENKQNYLFNNLLQMTHFDQRWRKVFTPFRILV
jgi:hypothetical protein